jgi:thiamine-phosphate pyrophosphorylase
VKDAVPEISAAPSKSDPVTLPPVYPILDTHILSHHNIDPLMAAEALLEAGAAILQFRHKAFFSRETYDQAKQIGNLCGEGKAAFILNDRADYAALLNAGLHVGQEDLPPSDARRLIGSQAILGFSTHNADQMKAAQSAPADYFAFGPIFTTVSKERPDPATGTESLRQIRSLTTRPLVAIGGITLENAAGCYQAGADSLAIISGLIPETPTKSGLRARMTEWLQQSVILHKWPRPLP